jgi:nitroreductase/NAD-dependent dihydropyrimidine dehydrogenase PreA subunit
MIQFEINQGKCISCGLCVADCPARIIAMVDGTPAIAPENRATCYKCQHCLAVCPTAAVSILGLRPEDSLQLNGVLPNPDLMETLIKGRRSVRHYQQENLDPALLERLLQVAWYAPTGINSRQVRFTVVDDRAKLAALHEEIMAGMSRLVQNNVLPAGLEFMANIVQLWEEKGVDTFFRGAPHLLIASAPQDGVSPLPDCLIALSYFDLFAQANGVGTLWDGLAKIALNDLVPETRKTLGIPEDHLVGYAMVFGKPAVHYPRGVQRGPANIHRVS